jgi:hypothetical protein
MSLLFYDFNNSNKRILKIGAGVGGTHSTNLADTVIPEENEAKKDEEEDDEGKEMSFEEGQDEISESQKLRDAVLISR